jgi:hypothetical protein
MSVPRLRRNLTGVVTTGNGSARIDTTLAEEIAQEALATAQEALKAAKSISEAADKVLDLDDRLNAEIARSSLKDIEHSDEILKLSNVNNLQIMFLDNLNSEELWLDK